MKLVSTLRRTVYNKAQCMVAAKRPIARKVFDERSSASELSNDLGEGDGSRSRKTEYSLQLEIT